MSTLKGKVVWITGASSGVGRATAVAFGDAGATVVLSGRNRVRLEQVAEIVDAHGGAGLVVPIDVGEPGHAQTAVVSILERYKRLDILINCAGINIPNRWWRDFEAKSWQQVINTNLSGVAFTTAAVLPTMRLQHDGLIINISSWAGRFNSAFAGTAYISAKSAVIALSESTNRQEFPSNIRCTCICPGEISTPIMLARATKPSDADLARMLQPEDIASLVLFVAHAPSHMCLNEVVVSPTYNREFVRAS